MTQIKISIDCDEEHCGNCHQRNWNLLTDEFCFLFRDENGAPTYLEQDGLEFKRCPQCLAATVEE